MTRGPAAPAGELGPDRDEPDAGLAAVHAAGAVLWRPAGGGPGDGSAGVEVAVVHRPHHRDWSLPKGKLDEGETRADTAVRELAEETGFDAVLGRRLGRVRYPVGPGPKTVDYWDARATGGAFVPNGETDELRWLPPAGADALLSYDTDRVVLSRFRAAPEPRGTLLLVRHADAGRRGGWDGPDDERPLSDEGREQADRLAALLALYGVRGLHAVPRTRCRQTLEPLAAHLGTAVVDEPAFTDEAVAAHPDTARERLLALAAEPEPVAVCAQGDGIPALVADLAGRAVERTGRLPAANRDLAAPPARKGSVWALCFHHRPDGEPALVAADYARDARF